MRKYKKALLVICIIIIGLLFGNFIYAEAMKNVDLKFSQTEFEYGCENVDFNSYLNLSEDLNDVKIVEKTTFDEKKVGKQEILFEVYRGEIKCNDKTYTFEVKDTNIPVIELDGETVTVEYGNKYDPAKNVKSVTDIVDGELEYEISGDLDTKKIGNYKQTVISKDKNGNENSSTFSIEVKDTKGPEITLKNSSVTVTKGNSYDPKSNVKSVKDPVDGDIEYTVDGTVDTKKVGSYKITVKAKDANGNETKKEFTVNVKEKTVSTAVSNSSSNNNTSTTGSTTNSTYPLVYQDGSAKITIYKEWYGKSWVYAAHLQFTNYSRLKTAVANNSYGSTETTYHAANRLGAIFAVNGDYSAKHLNYPVARNGKVYNNKNCWVPAIYNQNNGKLLSAWESGGTPGIVGQDLQTLVNSGLVTDTFSFGPPILSGGAVQTSDTSSRAQRTFIGTNGRAGDIWVVVSEGRYTDGVSAGMTYKEMANYLKSKGCSFGVPLDGGGSSTMIFRGKILTKTSQRAVVDFLYFK